MSYAEQQWTVDQVNEKIQSSDAGKDLYILGIPRVFTQEIKKISGRSPGSTSLIGKIDGKGIITDLYVYSYSFYASSVTTRAYVAFKHEGSEYTIGVKATASGQYGKVSNTLAIDVDKCFVEAPTDNVYPDNTVFNGFIPFDDGFEFYITGSSSYPSLDDCSGSVSYMLYDAPPSSN